MRVFVIADRCQGHSMCALQCPEVFQLSDEDGHASTKLELVPKELESKVLLAERSCPEQAIEVNTEDRS